MGENEPSWLSAGVIIVRRFDDEWRYLLLRVYNYRDFPKGEVEPGEDRRGALLVGAGCLQRSDGFCIVDVGPVLVGVCHGETPSTAHVRTVDGLHG